MFMMNGKEKQLVKGIIFATVGISVAYIVTKYSSRFVRLIRQTFKLGTRDLKCKDLHVVDSLEQSQLTHLLKKECEEFRALGFDCEWVTEKGHRRPVALLQLASRNGVCVLYRLCKLRCLPQSLTELLEDSSVLKVGVAPLEDARHLARDYGVRVQGCLDLRHLAGAQGLPVGGLAALASSLLGVRLPKDWRVRCSNWEAPRLSPAQLQYAALDALAGVLVFAQLVRSHSWPQVLEQCEGLVDVRMKEGVRRPTKESSPGGSGGGGGATQDWVLRKKQCRMYSTLQRPMYDNCFLLAPDNQLLCTCDLGKARWYLEKQLGMKVSDDPFIVRLNFEPASRDLPQYYMEVKANRCVVCGYEKSYHRKFIVPQEYRKYFPKELKDHQSHDVLLLCTRCHAYSNVCDQVLRRRLAHECNAPLCPLVDRSDNQSVQLQKVKSAARALLRSNAVLIPAERRQQLEELLREFLGLSAPLTPEQLREAANIHISPQYREQCETHGSRVVRHYAAPGGPGLRTLEQMWRQHFLSSMQPRFLPRLWSVHHKHTRDMAIPRVHH